MLDNIANYILALMVDVPLYIFMIVMSIILLILKKKMTTPFMLLIFSVIGVVPFMIASNRVIMSLAIIFLFAGVLYFKYMNTDLNYRKDVYSIGMFFNGRVIRDKQHKAIGKIMPYNSFQLPFNRKVINLRDEYARGLIMITGSPGSGKTYGMMSMLKQDLDNGKRVVYFDYKGDEKIIKELREVAKSRGIPVFEMSEYKTDFDYDPMMSLNKTGRIEALLNTRKWAMDGADAHYRTSTHLLIQKYVNKFEDIYDNKKPYTVAFYEFIKKEHYDRQSADAYSTLTKMIEILLTSQMKDVWYGNHGRKFDFSIEEQYLVIFSFVSSNKELANSVSSFVFKDLLDTGTVEEYDKEIALYIDEYGTLENSLIIKDIIEKGRSCGILTTISMQDINQIVINTNQAYLNSMLGIINTFIIYSGSTKITAEMLGGVQLYDIESIMVTLRKPDQRTGATPTAMYISRYSTVEKDQAMDVFKIKPYIVKDRADKTTKPLGNNIYNTRNNEVDNNKESKIETETKSKTDSSRDGQLDEDGENLNKDDYMKFL